MQIASRFHSSQKLWSLVTSLVSVAATTENRVVNNRQHKYASYPDWRISPHADPPGCIPVNSLRDVRYQHFSLFGLVGANHWAKVHQNRR